MVWNSKITSKLAPSLPRQRSFLVLTMCWYVPITECSHVLALRSRGIADVGSTPYTVKRNSGTEDALKILNVMEES
jgi:hypothetical protein